LKYDWLCKPTCSYVFVDTIIVPQILSLVLFLKGDMIFSACVKYFFLMPFVAIVFYFPSVIHWLHTTRLVRALNRENHQPNLEFVKRVIKQGVDVNIRNLDGSTAIISAARNNQDPAVTLALLEAGADLSIRSYTDEDALVAGCANSNPEIIRILVKAGIPINGFYGELGSTPLMIATFLFQDPIIITTLLECGADVNLHRRDGLNALLLAAMVCKDARCLSILLEANADIETRDMNGNTALSLAAFLNQNAEVTKLLIEAGLDINAKDKTGNTALMHAAINNPNPDVFSIILKAGADVNAINDQGLTAYNYACHNKMLVETEAFLILQKLQAEMVKS